MKHIVQQLLGLLPFFNKKKAEPTIAPYDELAVEAVMGILRRKQLDPALVVVRSSTLAWTEIQWADAHDDHCFIFPENIAAVPEKVAWFQSSKKDRHLLVAFENGTAFHWVPETSNPAFGCHCLLLCWHLDHLIFVYQEKHHTCICAVQNGQVTQFSFTGGFLNRKDDIIAYWIMDQPKGDDAVLLLRIPELTILPPITREKALETGLLEG